MNANKDVIAVSTSSSSRLVGLTDRERQKNEWLLLYVTAEKKKNRREEQEVIYTVSIIL